MESLITLFNTKLKKLEPSDSLTVQSIGLVIVNNSQGLMHGTHSFPFILQPKVFSPCVVTSGQGQGSGLGGTGGGSLLHAVRSSTKKMAVNSDKTFMMRSVIVTGKQVKIPVPGSIRLTVRRDAGVKVSHLTD